jgi:hypothetical protein
MDELSIIFSSRPATEVFYVASIIFILAYLAGFLFVLGRSRAPGRRAVIRRLDRQARSHAGCPRLAQASIESTTCTLASV